MSEVGHHKEFRPGQQHDPTSILQRSLGRQFENGLENDLIGRSKEVSAEALAMNPDRDDCDWARVTVVELTIGCDSR